MKTKQPPTITLRAMEPEDADLLTLWESDPAGWGRGAAQLGPAARADMLDFTLARASDAPQTGQMRLMIDIGGDRTVTAGCVDMFGLDLVNRNCAVGVLVDKAHRNRGVGTAALMRFCEYLADVFGAEAICATTLPSNAASQKMLERAGFTRTGIRPLWYRTAKGREDEIIYTKITQNSP